LRQHFVKQRPFLESRQIPLLQVAEWPVSLYEVIDKSGPHGHFDPLNGIKQDDAQPSSKL